MTTLSQFKQGSILFRGDYQDTVTYYPNNLTVQSGSIYICIQESLGNAPTNPSYFDLFTGPGEISVETTGSGTDPATFTLSADGATITLNKP